MHIDKPKQEFLDAEKTRKNLEIFLHQPTPAENPPCPNCKEHIVSKCNISCLDAQTALSSQPEEFPIEPNVAPLVFALMSTCVVQTCWSCEGHMDENNNLIKVPTVSFYTSSSVCPQLLHLHIQKLKIDKKLVYAWQIVLTDYAQTWGQTYSIIPNLNFVNNEVRLGGLQNDLKVIAENLQENMKYLARVMILELDEWLKIQGTL